MKILITGGAGFIGSNFLNYMVKRYPDYHFVNVDLLTYAGNLKNLQVIEHHLNYRFIRGNITDRERMEKVIQQHGIEAIIHFAAESHVDRSITNPDVFVKTNVMGTQVLLDLAKKYTMKKYIQISTDEVYGTLGDIGSFTEETPLAPNSPYSASKAGADLLVRAYYETFGLPVNITRCSNNYGPYHFPEKLIPLMIINALHDHPLPVYGDGLHVRDWLYVEDHCAAIDLVLHQGKAGEVYNVGGNNERTNLEIVKTIVSQVGKPKELIRFVNDRPGHDRRYAINSTKIRRELGWVPQVDLEKGLGQTVQWYVNHPQWWEDIVNGDYQKYYEKQYGRKRREEK